MMLPTCVSTVRSVSHSRRAMPTLVRPSAISASTSRSRGVSRASGSSLATRAEQRRDHLGVEGGAARGDPAQRVEEVVDVEDPVLEQVAEAAPGDQLDRVPGLDVLGEQHDGQVGLPLAEVRGRAGAVVGAVRGHPDVDDREVRQLLLDDLDQRDRVRGPADHLVAGVLEQPGQALAEEGRVLADHDAHGSAASTSVPRPSGLATCSEPPRAATRSPQAGPQRRGGRRRSRRR